MNTTSTKFANRKAGLMTGAVYCLASLLDSLDNLLSLTDLQAQVLGTFAAAGELGMGKEWPQAEDRLQATPFWQRLSALYDYAVEGISAPELDNSYIVTEADEVVALLRGHGDGKVVQEWKDLVWMGDGRVGLDEGMALMVEKLALLAGVDVRTVRNAVSAGTLEAFKRDQTTYIDSASARRWLMGRKGFRPTVIREADTSMVAIQTPGELAQFCRIARIRVSHVGHEASDDNDLEGYPGLTQEMLTKVEAGVFDMPLSAATVLADFYAIERGEFLQCVMRVFFPNELRALGRVFATGSTEAA